MQKTNNNTAGVLVVSCDKYADLWQPYFTLLFKYWPNPTLPIYLLSNKKTYADKRVIPLMIGEDKGWSISLRLALQQFQHEVVLLSLEDFFITANIDTQALQEYINFVQQENIGYLRLFANPGPNKIHTTFPKVGFITKGVMWRCALQMALWQKNTLLELLRDHESPWQFEMLGSRRSDHFPIPFMSVVENAEPIPYYPNIVEKGKWVREAIQFFRARGLTIDTSQRPIETRVAQFIRKKRLKQRMVTTWKHISASALDN